jgi:hypothetical protein
MEREIYRIVTKRATPSISGYSLDLRDQGFKEYWELCLETLASDNPNYAFVPDHFLFIIKLYLNGLVRYFMARQGTYPWFPLDKIDKIEQNLLNLDRYHLISLGDDI